MVEMLMRRMAFLSSGGIPPEPTNWATLSTYTSSATWTCPKDGWYRFHVIGKGGNGGDGGGLKLHSYINTETSDGTTSTGTLTDNYYAPSGGGGGAGGYAVTVVYIKKGQTVPITIGSSAQIETEIGVTKATYGYSGSAGELVLYSDAPSASPGTFGNGGTATGGNVKNEKGKYGSAGKAGGRNSDKYPTQTYASGGAGGTLNGALISTSYGAGGRGGNGGYWYRTNTSTYERKYKAATGRTSGGAAAVIIEQAA